MKLNDPFTSPKQNSHPFYVFLHFTHPPLLERLKALDYEIE
ncbi:hypothetical protein [Helicobacter pylori]|nr:hypothetical protein [Helicobacter pylori]